MLSFSSWFECSFSPFPPRRRSALCPPAPRGPPLPPSLLPLALRAGARSHTHPCDSMGCQESSVWHVLRWRWERADSSTQRVETAPAALPLLSSKLSPQHQFRSCFSGWLWHCWVCLALGWLQWGRCFPKLSDWSSPWVGNLGKAFAELQVILPFIL